MGRGLLEPWHIIIIILLIGVLFGWKKLPDAARSLGRSMRIFKSEVEEMKKDGKPTPSAASSDTVKGEKVPPSDYPVHDPHNDLNNDPIQDPTRKPTREPDPVTRETQNHPPA
jgi:sec-independent protein translocase protein TatA